MNLIYKLTKMMYNRINKLYRYVMTYNGDINGAVSSTVSCKVSRFGSELEPKPRVMTDVKPTYGIDGFVYPDNLYKEVFEAPKPYSDDPLYCDFSDAYSDTSKPVTKLNNSVKRYYTNEEMKAGISSRLNTVY